MMRKAQGIRNSNWTTESNEDEMNLSSRTNLVKREEKKKLQAFETETLDTRFKEIDDDISFEKSTSVSNPRLKKLNRSSKLFVERNLGKSNDSEKSIASSFSQGIDVIVDIHREYKEPKSHENGMGDSLEVSNDTKIFSKRNVLNAKSKEESDMNSIKSQRLQERQSDGRVVDSLDLIEEFAESPVGEEHNETTTKRLSKGEVPQYSTKEKPRSRRQWDTPENISQIEESRRPRKRWSKDTTVIRLPEVKSISSTTSSLEDVSPLAKNSKRPIPAIRKSLNQDSFVSFDNPAFVSENEEILCVETDHNYETKIEMRKINNRVEGTDRYLSKQDHRDSSSEGKASEDAEITIEHPSEFEAESNALNFGRQRENAILDIENFEDSDSNEVSSKGRSTVGRPAGKKNSAKDGNDNSDASQSLERIAKRLSLSDEDVTTHDRGSGDTKSTPKSRIRSKKHTVQDTLSLNDSDDDLEEDHSCNTLVEDDGKKITTKRRRLRSEKDKDRQKRKGKKKEFHKDDTSSSIHASYSNTEDGSRKKKKKRKKKEDVKYVSIIIHRADMLEIDYITKHPMVKVHIVRAETGEYLKSMEMLEGGTQSTYLQPAITGKFDFKENRSMTPIWEEELIFEHDFNALLKTEDEQIVILFEVIDLLSFAEASFTYDKFGSEGCWYKIAWAFLKPVGRNNTLHTDKKVRLQLYRPRRNIKYFERHKCEVYTWWRSNSREKYPSSLFITATSVDPPKLEPVFYQQLSLHDLSEVRSESPKDTTRTSESINLPKWTRLAAQSCKIPNEKFFETEISENGCFYIAFSSDGKYLACVLSEEYDYPIVIYQTESKKIHVRFLGHKTFVYTLNWSDNNNYLLSVSSDQTARVWDVQNQIVQHIEMMPHPSYVYCGKFNSGNASIVATGCYDRVARIWVKDKKSKNRDLSQELEGHEGFVNCMCFQKNGNLLTADSVGIIIVWIVKKNRKLLSRREWHISRKIKVREIEGITINTIVLHPLESRLLVHSRNNGLRMLDLATGVILQKYTELNNQRIQSTACISPCGGLILCGGEDSSLNIWSLETGTYLAKYTIDRNFRAVTCIDYHPYDHVLAFSTFGSPSPVRILRYNKDAIGEDVGLNIMEGQEIRLHSGDATTKLFNVSLPPKERSRANSKKRVPDEILKGRNHQSDRSYRSHSRESVGNIIADEEDERYKNTKLKLRRLNEAEETLKNRSACRLYNIIEKIDRILSNTSKSSDDLESGGNYTSIQESSKNRIFGESDEHRRKKEKRNAWKLTSLAYSTIHDQASSYFESSAGSSVKNDTLELKPLQDKRENYQNIKRKRSKSAKEPRTRATFEDDLPKTFSDSTGNFQMFKTYGKIVEPTEQENVEHSFRIQSIRGEHLFSSKRNTNCFATDQSSSPSSTGTYVVEKADVERNNDGSSVKVSENETLMHRDTKNDRNVIQISGSESSTLSNATFTIENEIPIPKPRKKKNLA